MNDTTRSALVAGLAVLAVALAAATLESTIVPERGPAGESAGGGGPTPMPGSGPKQTPGETVAIPYLSEILTVLAAIALLACLAYAIVHRRRALAVGLGVVALLGLAFLLFRYVSLPTEFGERPEAVRNGSLPDAGSGNGSGEGGTGASGPGQWLIVLFVLGLAVAGAVGALVRTSDDGVSGGASEEGESGDAAAVGRAAGRAADRLEGGSESDGDTENEVYRAWIEMTELLDVDDPETSTPGEFAAAAIEAGLGRDDVDELTRLFEDVRYGDAAPSDEAERRAIEIFRRIEDRYAGGAS